MLDINQSTMQSMQAGDETTEGRVKLSRQQFNACQKALEQMTQKEAHGAQKRAGKYIVGFAIEQIDWASNHLAEQLAWEESQDENLHVEIVVQDGTDGHFIPGLAVHTTLVDENGNVIGTQKQPFLLHPWLFHYGRNWRVPREGLYTLRVRIEATESMRQGKLIGKRFAGPLEVEFTGIEIKTEQLLS